MRLLFDQHLSHRLVASLADIFPSSQHVRDHGMRQADDPVIWKHAEANGLTIVSKDGDFHQLSLLFGPPPKVIWLRVGNSSTASIEALLRARFDDIDWFHNDPMAALLVIDP